MGARDVFLDGMDGMDTMDGVYGNLDALSWWSRYQSRFL